MRVNNNTDETAYSAVSALVVYRNNSGDTLCTVNAIKSDKIMPGDPVDGTKLAGLFRTIKPGKTAAKPKTLVWRDPQILADGTNAVLWYAPPCRREIFFSCRNRRLMKASGKMFPYPGLVFLARGDRLQVYAVKRRPSRRSKLYRAPFWNIFDSAIVCLPSGARNSGGHTPKEWEDIFYMSAFSHPNGNNRISRTAWPKLVSALIRAGAEKFPADELIPAGLSVCDILEGEEA